MQAARFSLRGSFVARCTLPSPSNGISPTETAGFVRRSNRSHRQSTESRSLCNRGVLQGTSSHNLRRCCRYRRAFEEFEELTPLSALLRGGKPEGGPYRS